MKADNINSFKMINSIYDYVRKFLFILEIDIYSQDRFHNLSL